MKSWNFIICAVLLLMASSLAANPGVLSGRIVDSNALPLPGANIYISDLKIGCVTDLNGFYRLPKVPEGEFTVKVSYIGYLPVDKMVKIDEDQNTVVNMELKEGISMSEIKVVGTISDQAKALNQQKTSVNITNIISSNQVESFPDANIGDALKRISGISVQYDQGEARFGNIRGLSPQMNSVSINGERIPSAEAETRSVQLDLVPSDMVQSIEVNKVITPDMDGDAIGGSVNLVTRSHPSRRRISAEIGSGYNFISEKPMLKGYFMYADKSTNDKFGYNLSASYLDHSLGSDNKEFEWEKDDADGNGKYDISDMQIRQYLVQRIRTSVSGNFDYAFNANHKLELSSIYNRRFDWENRYRLRYKKISYDEDLGKWTAQALRQTKGGGVDSKHARLEDQTMMMFSLGGNHLFGDTKLDWKVSYSKASEERLQERYIAYKNKLTSADNYIAINDNDTREVYITPSLTTGTILGSEWGLDELTEQNQYTEEFDKNIKINYEIPLFDGSSVVRLGIRYKGKEKERVNDFLAFSPTNEDGFNVSSFKNLKDWSKDNFLAGDYQIGRFVTNDFLGSINFSDASNFEKKIVLEELAGNYNASEDIYASYIMWTQKIGRLKAVVGSRIEQTKVNYSGFVYDDDAETLTATEKSKDDYINVLPSVNLRFEIDKKTNLKLAWSNALARPDYYKLVPFRALYNNGTEIELGNPDLVPMTSMNFDFLAEHYFSTVGIISGGLFYKDLKDVIIDDRKLNYTFEGREYEKYKKAINGGDGYLFGVEVAFQRQLDFLPGLLRQISFYSNYTYNKSELELNLEGREGEKASMPGSPEHQMNISLGYDDDKINTRLSLNYSGDFIDEFGAEKFYDRYYDKSTHLDYNVSYKFKKSYQCYLKVNNILNQPLRYYQGSSQYTMQEEYYNTTFKIGVRMSF